jgi:exopolyphosphatase/guanosine-5'-triphosphate,3'-diphosphate pyrophosphatase
VDTEQLRRVRGCALQAFDQLAAHHPVLQPGHRALIGWAADLHETGLSVSHSHYERHSGYLVSHSDMAGFGRQEQQFLAELVRYHRRALTGQPGGALPERLHQALQLTLACLRLACILCRTRDDRAVPDFSLQLIMSLLTIEFGGEWMEGHPLTLRDLREEGRQLDRIGIQLEVKAGNGRPSPDE